MTKANILATLIMIAVLTALLLLKYKDLEPDTVTFDPPKQPHHVIYITMCGVLEGIILTTDPIQFADYTHEMTPEMKALEFEALAAGRAFSFGAGLWVICATLEPGDLEVIKQ